MLLHLLSLALALLPTQTPEEQQPDTPAPATLEEQLQDFDRLRRARDTPEAAVLRLHGIGLLGTEEAVDALLRLLSRLEGKLAQAAVHAIALNRTPYARDKLRLLARDRVHADIRR